MTSAVIAVNDCYFKPDVAAESYLSLVELGKFWKSFSTFRTFAHDLLAEKDRHLGIERNLRYCLFCYNALSIKKLRLKYIHQKLYKHPISINITYLWQVWQ